VAGTEAPTLPRSLAHPVVILLTTAAKVALEQKPCEHIPDNQLFIVSGTD